MGFMSLISASMANLPSLIGLSAKTRLGLNFPVKANVLVTSCPQAQEDDHSGPSTRPCR
jgi:hypothetical protein